MATTQYVASLLLAQLMLRSVSTDPTTTFRIHVVGQLHEKVEKVWVDFPSLRRTEILFPDADGIVSIPDLPLGTFKVRMTALGRQAWDADLRITEDQERPLVVTLKNGVLGCSPHHFIEYSNEPGKTLVRGVVADDRGRKLRGIRIDWQQAGEKKPVITLYSSKQGQFDVPHLAPGTYKATVNAKADNDYEIRSIDVVLPADEVPFITINLSRKGFIEICE